jgi:hypothetical protein
VRYAKLAHKVGDNPDIGDTLDDNPRAVALFLISLARCDVYGILPADPRRYKIAVVPGSELTAEPIAEALDEQERRGWIRRYTDSAGTDLLHILKYHEFQDVRWPRVGPPEHELPDWWQPPEALMEWLQTLATGNNSAARRAWGVVLDRYCGTYETAEGSKPSPGVIRDKSGSSPAYTQTQTQTQTQTHKDLLPSVPVASDVDAAPADPAPVVVSEPTPTATTRPPKQTPEQIEADIAELTAGFRNGDLEAVEAFLVMAATHRANRTLANTKRRAFLVDLLAIRNLPEMTAEGFAHGIQAAVNADADNANYVKKAALGYATKSQRASPGGTGKQPRLGPAPSGTFDDPDEALKGWYGKHD